MIDAPGRVAGVAAVATDNVTRRWHWWAVAAACFLLLLESVILIRTRWVEDESWLASEAYTLAQEGYPRMPLFPGDPEYKAEVGVTGYLYSLAVPFKVFGPGVAQGRLLSAAFSIGMVIVVFLLAREIAGPLCGVAAAALTAADTLVVLAARTVRPEAEVALLSWLSMLFLYWAIQRRSLKFAIAAGAVCGIGLLTHPLAMAFLLAAGLLFCLEFRWTVWKQPLVWAFSTPVVLAVAGYLAWCFSDPARIASFHSVWLVKTNTPWSERILGESERWKDFIGLSSQRVVLPFPIPLRIHIALAIVLAFVFLFRHSRRVGMAALMVLLANLALFVYLVNKGPRYVVMLSPLFAIVLAYFAFHTPAGRARRLAAGLVAVVFLTQLAGDAFWLYKFRSANYADVTRQLRAIVPPDASVYGLTTFWLALYDRTYYACDRTTFDYAVQNLHPQYLILYDRVMMHGSGHGTDDFADLRAQATDFVQRQGTLAGSVSNDFYGDLKVYRVAY